MKFYIASRIKNRAQVRALAQELTKLGWEHTFDWTMHDFTKKTDVKTLKSIAQRELAGVKSADIVIILTPQGRGTHVELGMAAVLGKVVCIHHADDTYFNCDNNTSAFYWLPNVAHCTGSVDDLVEQCKQIALQ